MSGILQTLIGSLAGAVKDAYFKYVGLLLPGNGTNGAQNNTFLDASTNNFTITRNGNTTQGTFSPYGANWSNYFDGANDRLTIADNAVLRPGTGNFTIEAWIYRNAAGVAHTVYAKGGASTGFVFQVASTNVLRFTDTTTNIDSTGTIPAATWTHVAAVREGTGTNQFKLYINGVNDGTGTVSTNFNQTEEARIGEDRGATGDFAGHISNFRYTAAALYTSTFVPSTEPLTTTSQGASSADVELLTCQSNRFIDNSTNAFAITRNGDVSVQRFSPFSPSAAYAAADIGGSGYFDGTGDYLSVPSNTAFQFGTGDFTVECWIFSNATQVRFTGVICQGASTTSGWFLSFDTGNILRWTDYANAYLTSSTALTNNTWSHVAVARSGTSLKMFLNGTQVASATNSTSFGDSVATLIGSGSGSYVFNGYISNVRIVKGTAVYTSAFTPPTAPLTAITNTSLLCNFTNAGIIDNAMMNDLETRGNAQISTAQSKFGGSSIAFDGTGDYLIVPNNVALQMGSGDFTIEFWIYFASISGYQTTFDKGYTNAGGLLLQTGNGNGRLIVYAAGSAVITETGTGSTGAWIHYALVRSGTTLTLYRDGTSSGSATNSTNFNNANQVGIGAAGTAPGGGAVGDYPLNGYIDDLRITKGYARYTANFTPPAAAFPTS